MALTISAPCAAASALVAAGTPEGFEQLAGSKVTLVDVYFGGRKIAETLAQTRPGLLQFRSPGDILAALPSVIRDPVLLSTLAGQLSSNDDVACGYSNANSCGILTPQVLGIVYDEEHFRVEIFVNPKFLATSKSVPDGLLPTPSAPLSLTSALGLAASGSLGEPGIYNVQNRTVLAFRNARIRTSNAFASKLGWVVDDLVGEVEHNDLRYSAGLFWGPGNDFIGQRRIIGAGLGTQFDTSVDRETLRGTPLVLFLARPARVELVVDGRLVSSRSYQAGNNELDTSQLSDGSYSVLLRIQEQGGSTRDERRFFVKNAHVPPVGRPVYFAYAGVLANTLPHRPISASRTIYYQAGAAWRLNNAVAFDLSGFGTQRKAIVEAGGWLIKPLARIHVAALASTAGDSGLLLQLASGGQGPINFNFDLRRIWAHNDQPLVPLPSYVETFESTPATGIQLANGSYAQAIGSLGLRLGTGYASIVGTYRKDRKLRADYSIGPSLNLPLAIHPGLQTVLEASAQRTRTSTIGFVGVRLLYTSGAMSVMSTFGRSIEDDRTDLSGARTQSTGSLTAQYSTQTPGGTLLTGEAGADRNIDSSTVHAGGTIFSQLGNARLDLLHTVEGGRSTQYDLSFQSGLALSTHAARIGAQQTDQSALIIKVTGDSAAAFQVMVDESPRGKVRMGQPLSLFVPGYRRYRVRLVPIDAAQVDYDAGTRDVTLYPGNVQPLEWKAQSYFTLIAQAVKPGGKPIIDAIVRTKRAIAQTDSSGYFQLDLRRGDRITIMNDGTAACQVQLPDLSVTGDYTSIGKVVCR